MSYDKDQNEFALPAGNDADRSASNFLPKYFRTDTNKKFISSTIDQMISPGVVEKINAFAGRRYAKATIAADSYLSDVSKEREDYQFEPAIVYKDNLENIEFFKDYNDYISQIKIFKGTTSNHSLLNSQEFYSWNPNIDWDKFTNFREYYWLPLGPEPISILGQSREVVSTYTVTLVDDGDNYAYLFTPNGFTRNPTLKLYKGQKYRFEINTPGHPLAIAISRNFTDIDLTTDVELINQNILYKKGVVSDTDYVENGILEFTVPDDAPETLFYVSQNDINTSGAFAIFEITENTVIDVNAEIVGKKTYKTNTGVELSNGMKVYFQGTVTPEIYSNGFWYVEGVGAQIKLISESDLEIPSIFTSNFNVPFDGDTFGFDQYPFEDATAFPGTKDYIVINRASADRNPWTRYNRWFHKSVVEKSFEVNNLPVLIDENQRAKRPIIEFNAGLKLLNHGTKAKHNVDLVDTFTKDAFSIVEGSLGYNVDGVDLVDGMRVVFAADTDILVNGKIYDVKFIVHNGRRQISLVETTDSTPSLDDVILVLQGNSYKGKMFYYNGTSWKPSQEKTKVNQSPLFELFDKDGNSFSDNLVYPASSFNGNKVFSYKVGSGLVDSELGFALSYQNIANVGDITFDFNLLSENFTFQDSLNESQTVNTDTGYLKVYNLTGTEFVYENAWKKAAELSKQAVIRQITVSSKFNNFAVDVFDNSGLLTDLEVKVYVNSKKLIKNVDYIIENINNVAHVKLTNDLVENDILLLKCYSDANKNQNGFYEIPINLERNPLNENITSFTLGQVNDHVNTIIEDHPEFSGVFPGTSNLRDIGNQTPYGKRFVQHSGPVNLSMYHLTDKDSNIIKAIKYARREYAKFKRQFIFESERTGFHGSTKDHVDLILATITKDKTSSMPFYFSDMLGFGAAKRTLHTIEFAGPAYFALSKDFNLTTLSASAVGVYLNQSQLLYGKDYTFTEGFVYVTADLQDGDIVEIYEYESTNGSYIPPTPSKLGLYPKYLPEIFVDNTYFEPKTVIQGHDGSIILGFGDYRDDLILELEMRIYNNIKCDYDKKIIDIYDFVGGKFRNTKFSKENIDVATLSDFAQWLEISGSPDYSVHDFWDQNNSFTFNYSLMTDKDGNPLKGFWRNIYKTYFDTDRPHTNPWEMLGFTIKPDWWETVYGPAPYTKDNLILWSDLQEGIVREPGKPVLRNPKYKRPGLLSFIPVNEYGQLLSPLESGLAQNFTLINTKKEFTFGDQNPIETAWRRSSEYPFALLTAWALMQPAKIIGLGYDYSRIKKDVVGNIVYSDTLKRITCSDLVFPSIDTNSSLQMTSGFVNYISNYMANKVGLKYSTYKTQLANITNQLAIKLGGYADKSKLKLVLDSRSPLNKTSVFVPDENYQVIFNTSSALDVAVLSGIIIEKTESGYIISGYDKEDPVFSFNAPIPRQSDPAITVGGISETFVTWGENQEYPNGTIVFYENRYYRSRITHTSGSTFDPSKYAVLSSLPIVGGVTALLRNEFEVTDSRLPYGSLLTSVQDVVDFMCGYEKYLINKGFKFEFFNNETEALEDMQLCIKEFMFWVTQNWDIGTVLTVSPVANKVVFEKSFYVVDDIYDSFYDYNLLTGDGLRLNREFSNIFRNSTNEFGIKPINVDEGIFLVKLPLVQKEHVILIDNKTVFNDVIFDKSTGYRQERIKLVGYRTDNWNGGLNIPGFIYDNAKVVNWSTWTDYAIGDIVKYKEFYYVANIKHTSTEFFDANNWNILAERPSPELLPNWDYRVNQFTDFYSLDTDNFDSEQQRLGQHLIGYQKREYLSNIITDTVSQYKFYQGYIQEKGTKNALTKLFDALSSANQDSLEFYEEWAVRLGQYGAVENIQEVEYVIDESKYRLEPQLFDLVSSLSTTRTDLVYEIAPYQTYLKPFDYNHVLFSESEIVSLEAKDNGYVRDEDIQFVSITRDQLLSLNIKDIQIGEFVWVTDDDQSWSVLRHVTTGYKIQNIVPVIPDQSVLPFDTESLVGFTVYFDQYTDLQKDDIVGIKTLNENINGFYKVSYASLDFAVFVTDTAPTFEEITDSSIISMSTFVQRRFADASDLNENILKLNVNLTDKVWIDDAENDTWGVYRNKPVFKLLEETINPTTDGDGFATSFAASDSNNIVVIGSPYDFSGRPKIRIYKRFVESSNKALFQTLEQDNTIDLESRYGYSVSVSPDGEYIAVGAPYASNAKTKFKGEVTNTTYSAGDIVSDRGILWKAKGTVTWAEDSTISLSDQDWEPVYIIETTTAGTSSGLTNQGVVYVYKRQIDSTYTLEHCITSPEPDNNKFFGYTVELRKDTTNNVVKLFVGEPGVDNVDTGRIYFLVSEPQWSYDINRNYKGIYSSLVKYNTDDVVYYNGKLKQALTNISAGVSEPVEGNGDWVDVNNVEHTGYVPRSAQPITADNEQNIYQNGKNIGKKFDVNKHGDIIILSAPINGVERVAIYRNLSTRWKYSQIIDTVDSFEDYGYSIAISDVGEKIAIAAPRNDDKGIDSGIVYIYKQETVDSNLVYNFWQTLESPFEEKNEAFGTGLDFDKNKIVISGKNTDRRIYTTFDNYLQLLSNVPVSIDNNGNLIYSSYVFDKTSAENEAKTTFDGGNTRFVSITSDTGRLAVFQEIGDYFIFAEDVEYNRNTKFNDISNFKLVDNHIYVGFPKLNPANLGDSTLPEFIATEEDSTIGLFVDIRSERNSNSWSLITQELGKVNISKIQRCFLYSKDANDIVGNLDIVDPRQGKIPGPAEQELSFKTFYDPAIYSVSEEDPQTGSVTQGIVVDSVSNWTDENVGKLWWDLSTASWYNPYQGTIQYRANVWNKLTIGASIDVYEWVGTELLPSEWNRLADTNEGFSREISGTSLYGDNVYSTKSVYDSVSKTFKNKYFYWVKNKRIVPANVARRLSAYDVARLIENPAALGYRFVAPLDLNKFAIYNASSLIEGTNTVLHFSFVKDPNLTTNIHSEYQLITESLGTSIVNSEIEQKWFDSLIGYDINNKTVPDTLLSAKQKYGILNFPRQSMFINRLEAVKQLVERANSVLINNQISDNFDLSKLLEKDDIPLETTGKYDTTVDNVSQLRFVGVAKVEQAILNPVIQNGKIVNVEIVNRGRGYVNPPTITIDDPSGYGAVLKPVINNLGQITSVYVRSPGKNYTENAKLTVRKYSVLVVSDADIGGRWAIYTWDKNTKTWSRSDNQSYDTTRYWNYDDWYATGYTSLTPINYVINQSYELFGLDDAIGDVVKIETVGSGGWLLLEKIDDQLTEDYTINYKTVGRENGTIQLNTRLYDYANTTSGFDATIYDNTFYDREPVVELRNILLALRDDIFVGDLAVEWNNLFFSSLRYVFSEQPNVDWAFKTSFVRAKHNLGNLVQKVNFQNDNLENYEDYVNEVKPYHTKVREYISSYTSLEPTGTLTTDFDLPPSYNEITKEIETSVATYRDNTIYDILDKYMQYPYRNWVDNNGYDVVSIDVADGGSGYKETPVVTVEGGTTTAKAYLSRGSVSKIEIKNKGGKYYKAPIVTITGTLDDNGRPAKAVAILGDGLVRKVHMIIKFDRVSGNYLFTDLNETQIFTGTGAKEKFVLKWPMNIKTDSYTVKINGIEQLSSAFEVGNQLDVSKGYDRHIGFVTFVNAPALDDQIEILYKKDIALLNASDRINFFYNPTTGMLGKDLSQLMDGVDYSGVKVDSIDFGNEQGFDVSAYGSLPWDTFDNTYDDEVFVLDGSTISVTLSKPLENGVEYNFYLNGLRLDDPNFDTSSAISNPNAVMASIIGDGVTTTVMIDEDIQTTAGDIIIIRKSTSDGSFTPTATSYDTALSGGNLEYTTATGITASDIVVDGDGFVTPTTSKGPEELVPGQVLDTLDIRVYHRIDDGVGIISVINYRIVDNQTVFDLPGIPQSNDGVIVKLNNNFVTPGRYSVNYADKTLEFVDSTLLELGASLSIMTIGTNGVNLIDSNYFVSDGSTNVFVTSAVWSENITSLVTVNGVIKQNGTDYIQTKTADTEPYPNRVKIEFSEEILLEGDFIQYTIYNSTLKTYSQVIVDRTFEADGATNYHTFDGIDNPVPFNRQPISHNIVVKVDNTILNPGYSITYTTTSERDYDIEAWQFEDTTAITQSEVLVFADYVQLTKNDFTYDPLNGRVSLLNNSIAPEGTRLDIYVIKDAEYYFVDTSISFDVDPLTFTDVGDSLELVSNDTSTIYTATVKSINGNNVIVETYRPDIRDEFIISNEFTANNVLVTITDVEYVLSDSLTFKTPPSSGEVVEIYQFSNHDVNNFERITYKVITTTVINELTADYTKRNLISAGYIPLRKSITSANYAWVAVNGEMLTPNIDYYLVNTLDAIQLNVPPAEGDLIDVIQFGNTPTSMRFGFRIFKDILNRTHYKRLNQDNSYILAENLNWYDARILLENTDGIFKPNRAKNIPGVIFIDGERIEYFEIRGNALLQLRRGTLGTGVKNVHSKGTVLYGQGPEENINYNDTFVTQTIISDGSTPVVLNYTPVSVNEIEVFVAGRKLRKNAIQRFNHLIDQDSPEADETIQPEFTLDGNVVIFNIDREIATPVSGEKIQIVKKIGKVWNDVGKSLSTSNNSIAKFLRGATIQLPK